MNENTAIVLLEAIFHPYSCAYAERPGNNHCVIRGDSSNHRLVGSLTLTPTLTLEQLEYKKNGALFSAWQNGASIKDDISDRRNLNGRAEVPVSWTQQMQLRGRSRQNSFHLTASILSAVYSLTSAFFPKSWTLPFSLPPSAARWRRQR